MFSFTQSHLLGRRTISLLLLLSVLNPSGGFCFSISPNSPPTENLVTKDLDIVLARANSVAEREYNTSKNDSDPTSGNLTTFPKPLFSLLTSAGIATRDPQDWDFLGLDQRKILSWAARVVFIANAEHSWEGMTTACMKWKDHKPGETAIEWSEKKACVYGAISLLVGTLAIADAVTLVLGNYLHQPLENANEFLGIEHHEGWHGQKRSLVSESTMAGLSKAFATEVRHLGIWNDTRLGLLKRDRPVARHVFGLSGWGQNMHFSALDAREDGNLTFRAGFGLDHDAAVHTLKTRDDASDYFHGAWFEHGGMDFTLSKDPSLKPMAWKMDVKNPEHFKWMYDQISCTFDKNIFFNNVQSAGLNFQVYDNWQRGTGFSGAIAPFLGDRKSAIDKIYPDVAGLELNEECMVGGGYSVKGKGKGKV
jgi:hypothetical protein